MDGSIKAVELTRSLRDQTHEETKGMGADELMAFITREAGRAMSMPGASSAPPRTSTTETPDEVGRTTLSTINRGADECRRRPPPELHRPPASESS